MSACLAAQSCPTLCDPMDCCLPGSSALGILQARILEWVAISLSRGSSQFRNRTQVSCVVGRFFTVWAIIYVYYICIHTHTHIHTHTFFLVLFSIMFISGHWVQFPVLYSRTLLFIHSIYNNLHLLSPNFQSIPLLSTLLLDNHKSVSLCLWVCLCFVDMFIYVRF